VESDPLRSLGCRGGVTAAHMSSVPILQGLSR
jgi:hypothetical protein